MDLKDKLNLFWKFLFLAVFTYGVISVSCCANSCSKDKQGCSTQKQCSVDAQKQCSIDKNQACCASKTQETVKTCGSDCTKPCCAKK